MSLTFAALHNANAARLPLFKNAQGETQHSGQDWSLNDWMVAVTGEVGEAANLLKKMRRGDFAFFQVQGKLAGELADIAIYLELLASAAGINLGDAIIATFNRKSDEVGAPIKLDETLMSKA